MRTPGDCQYIPDAGLMRGGGRETEKHPLGPRARPPARDCETDRHTRPPLSHESLPYPRLAFAPLVSVFAVATKYCPKTPRILPMTRDDAILPPTCPQTA